jgi:hypothetical protein
VDEKTKLSRGKIFHPVYITVLGLDGFFEVCEGAGEAG